MKYFLLLLLFSFSFSACDMLQKKEISSETKKKKTLEADDEEEEEPKEKKKRKKEPVTDNEIATNSKADILNNIIVHESGGLQVSRAFLSFEDGRLVPKNNHVALGVPVYLNLSIDGWKEEDGTVSLDASEKIVTDAGELVINATNLFKQTPEITESSASQINLKAGISKTRRDINYFVVNYRVWDKQGDGEIKGSYKLYIKEATNSE